MRSNQAYADFKQGQPTAFCSSFFCFCPALPHLSMIAHSHVGLQATSTGAAEFLNVGCEFGRICSGAMFQYQVGDIASKFRSA